MNWNYFSYLQTSYQKNPFTKYFPFNPKSPKNIKTENRFIQTGNGIIFPTYRLPIKKLISQNNFHSTWKVHNKWWKKEIELFKQEMELFFLHTDRWSKTFFLKYFLFNPNNPNPILETGNRIIGTGNGIIFHTCRLLIKKLLPQNIFHSTRGVQNQF